MILLKDNLFDQERQVNFDFTKTGECSIIEGD